MGQTRATDFPVSGGFDTDLNTGSTTYVVRLTAAGVPLPPPSGGGGGCGATGGEALALLLLARRLRRRQA